MTDPVKVTGAERAEAIRRFRRRERIVQDAMDDYRRFLDGLAERHDVPFVPWNFDLKEGAFKEANVPTVVDAGRDPSPRSGDHPPIRRALPRARAP